MSSILHEFIIYAHDVYMFICVLLCLLSLLVHNIIDRVVSYFSGCGCGKEYD